MDEQGADLPPQRGPVWHRARVAAVISLPVLVGLVAASVLGLLHTQEQVATRSRLVLAQLHEEAVLQQELISHAAVMGFLTKDLPGTLAGLRRDTSTNLSRLGDEPGSLDSVAPISAAWLAYQRSAGQMERALGMEPSTSMPASTPMPASAGMPASTAMPIGTGPMTTAPAGASPAVPAAVPDAAAYTTYVGALDSAISQTSAEVQDATTRSRIGSILTVTVEALILVVAFLGLMRVRHRAAEEHRRALAASEARFRSLVQNASDVVMVLDDERRIEYVTPSVLALLGRRSEDVVDEPLTTLLHPQDEAVVQAFLHGSAHQGSAPSNSIEFRLHHQDDRWVDVEALAGMPHDGSGLGLILTMRDTTERKVFEQQLAHQAFHDSLTGLPNRALFNDRLTHALNRRSDDASTVAVILLDLDDFKTVNDSLGHEAGDRVLAEVADRLRICLRSSDTSARLGGDEFVVLLEGIEDVGEAIETSRRILAAFARPIRLSDRELTTTASIGISIGMPQFSQAEELLRDADTAMYAAKSRGRGNVQVFEEVMHSVAQDRLAIKTDLERALSRDEFVLHYQPTVDLSSDQFSGFEALVRWNHPERGLVPPLEFIPLAEETGLIVPLGEWVLREACRQACAWRDARPGEYVMSMSVNVSVKQLEQSDFVDVVRNALVESGLEPSSLILEITEGVLLRETAEIAARLRQLKELGIRLAIDDFGTGYSSLGYLQTLPLDVLKIDKRFVDNVATGSDNAALASAIIAIGQALGMTTVAEGIEREDQANTLRRLECQYGQGYMFARPLTPAGIETLLGLAVKTTTPPRAKATSSTRLAGARTNGAVASAHVREWAREHGFTVADRGPVPTSARRAYAEAHSDA